jgi:hypothetical protein
VYGTIDVTTDTNHPFDPVSTYVLDGGPATSYTGVRSQQIIQYRVLYYQSPKLAAGQHTLLINSTVERGYYNLDYMVVQSVSNATNTSKSFASKDSSKS